MLLKHGETYSCFSVVGYYSLDMDTSDTRTLRLTVLCGNPRPSSRTLAAATQVADAMEKAAGPDGPSWARWVVDLADLGTELFAPSRPGVDAALSLVTHSDLLVVATPVFKGTYTGLLKSFLDWLPHRGLDGVVAVPLTVMAASVHSLAADVHLRPLLVELGATVPTASVVLTEDQLADGANAAGSWARSNTGLAVQAALSLHPRTRREEALA
jgi:FMN reductase